MSQVLLKAPAPDVTYSTAGSGTPYIAGGDGLFLAWEQDVAGLLHHGCEVVVDAITKPRRRKKADESVAEDAPVDEPVADEPESVADPEPETPADVPAPDAPDGTVGPVWITTTDPAPEQA